MVAEIHTKTSYIFLHLNANVTITRGTYCLLTCEGIVVITNKGERNINYKAWLSHICKALQFYCSVYNSM